VYIQNREYNAGCWHRGSLRDPVQPPARPGDRYPTRALKSREGCARCTVVVLNATAWQLVSLLTRPDQTRPDQS
jgi:hypothetical protein